MTVYVAAFIVLQNRNKQKGNGDMNIQMAASDGRAGFRALLLLLLIPLALLQQNALVRPNALLKR